MSTHTRGPVAISFLLLGALGSLEAGCSSDETTDTSSASGAGASAAQGTGGASSSAGAAGGMGGSAAGGGGSGGTPPTTYDCSAPTGTAPSLKLTEVATGISSPVLAKGAPGDLSRLFVVSRDGVILIIKDGMLSPTPFLDITGIVNAGGERGLLGLAFHPDYAANGRFFVHYSDANGDTAVAEYKRGADADTADPTQVGMVLTQSQPESNHNGGSIEFSPKDGFLYIFLGDGGGGGDQHGTIGNGQDTSTKLAKVLRIDVATLPYAIPAGNLTGAGVAPEIWDYGVRNPYRSSFDACTGDMYIGDVGQGAWEEVDVEPAGMGQNNYGWRQKEGFECYDPSPGCDTNSVEPMVAYPHGGDGNCVIGGYVYRGSKIPALRGTYFYGDNGSGHIWSFVWAGGAATAQTELTGDLMTDGLEISSFGQDSSGEVYVVGLGGSVHRIDAE